MIIREIPLPGATLMATEPFNDNRGTFARFFCERELAHIMDDRRIVNVNYSLTRNAGAIRGMHFQRHPHQEMKLVRCIRGAVFDVVVDLREDSPTFLQWHGEILSAENMHMLCVPEGFAHGFQSLADDCELLYLTTSHYAPACEGGIRFDDPAIGIEWPLAVSDISRKDASHPLLECSPNPLGGA
ncbi:MAG: dTDP-4-dehydrorhamnose 3,5-epimerase [Deltaproteobacteria bacterium]|nr:dTDP-4-dehydrorhamnose 3,5-epimerase [Deltaproteobacteria bacterium]